MLLELPTELMTLILKHCTTPSFLSTALTCRALYIIASTYRELILHHLHQTPGLKAGLEQHDARELFLLLRSRAAGHLLNANFYADRTLYGFNGRSLDLRASSVANGGHTANLAAVLRDDACVHIFHADIEGLISTDMTLKLPTDLFGAIRIFKTTLIDDGGISVLVRSTIRPDDADVGTSRLPFVQEARQSQPESHYFLLYYDLHHSGNLMAVCKIYDRELFTPVALAATGPSQFAISWQHMQVQGCHEVDLYVASPENGDDSMQYNYLEYKVIRVVDHDGYWPKRPADAPSTFDRQNFSEFGPVTGLRFNDRGSQLLYQYPDSINYKCYQDLGRTLPQQLPGVSNGHPNYCYVQFSDSQILSLSVGIPFFGTHETYRDEHTNRLMCCWKYLTMGAVERPRGSQTVVCLLKSEARCQASTCGHVMNLDRGRRLRDWTVVARLWGYQKPSNSLGSIIATAPSGTRIAIANWNTIHVWALEPKELIERCPTDFYPEIWQPESAKVVSLSPVTLQLDAVCFKVAFTDNEDRIIALTDRGVMTWDLGPRGTKARITRSLDVR